MQLGKDTRPGDRKFKFRWELWYHYPISFYSVSRNVLEKRLPNAMENPAARTVGTYII